MSESHEIVYHGFVQHTEEHPIRILARVFDVDGKAYEAEMKPEYFKKIPAEGQFFTIHGTETHSWIELDESVWTQAEIDAVKEQAEEYHKLIDYSDDTDTNTTT